jgi:hypothetical protein
MKTKNPHPEAQARLKTAFGLAFVLFLFSMTATSVCAQNSFQDPNHVPVKQEPVVKQSTPEVVVENSNPAPSIQKKEETPAQPYINYKGISDPEQAKAEWIKDNPEEYQMMLQPAEAANSTQMQQPAAETKSTAKPAGTTDDGSSPRINQ